MLASLAYMASRTGAAVVIVRHMNKGTGSALYRGSGSIGIVGGALAGLLVAPDPDDEGRRILANEQVEPGQDARRARLPDRRG